MIVRCSILDNKRKKKEISIRVGSNGVSSPPLIDSRSVAEWSTLVFLNGPLSLSLSPSRSAPSIHPTRTASTSFRSTFLFHAQPAECDYPLASGWGAPGLVNIYS